MLHFLKQLKKNIDKVEMTIIKYTHIYDFIICCKFFNSNIVQFNAHI